MKRQVKLLRILEREENTPAETRRRHTARKRFALCGGVALLAVVFVVAESGAKAWRAARERREKNDAPDRELEAGTTRAVSLGDGVMLVLVWCPPGRFVMGEEPVECECGGRHVSRTGAPLHEVTLTRGFWLGKYEVTQAQWEAVMGRNPSSFKNAGKNAPVETVSWNHCRAFLKQLNRRVGVGGKFRLPTEAEWEYACRAGTQTDTYAGDVEVEGEHNAPALDDIAWYSGNSGVDYEGGANSRKWRQKQYDHSSAGTHPVGLKRPNAWGLHDMVGNVAEWCSDWFGDYSADSATNPAGPATGSHRVHRGGGYGGFVDGYRAAYRDRAAPDSTRNDIGLRVVLERD